MHNISQYVKVSVLRYIPIRNLFIASTGVAIPKYLASFTFRLDPSLSSFHQSHLTNFYFLSTPMLFRVFKNQGLYFMYFSSSYSFKVYDDRVFLYTNLEKWEIVQVADVEYQVVGYGNLQTNRSLRSHVTRPVSQ